MGERFTIKELKDILEVTYTLDDVHQLKEVLNELIDENPIPLYNNVELKIIRLMIETRKIEIESWYINID
jgi:hypothetical protein|tara:strand:- start:11309 stop:11518 length:210 start_codon:yes stop_codon:yes gene_type:complete